MQTGAGCFLPPLSAIIVWTGREPIMSEKHLCTEADRGRLNDYLKRHEVLNLFFIGDIENFGFDSSFQHVWTEEEEDGIHAAYLQYRGNLCLQSYDGRLDPAFIDRICEEYRITCVNAETPLFEGLALPQYPVHEDCSFASMAAPHDLVDTALVKRLGEADVEAVCSLRRECFQHSGANEEESLRNTLRTHSGREYGIFEDGRLVSVAGSTAECAHLAMAVGVCTARDSRGRGYASMCITRLSNDLLAEGKTPCLFYNNPSAARIYKALGYQDVGCYSMRQKEMK